MKAFLNFGYPSQRLAVPFFVLVWFLRAYWLLMVAWFFYVEHSVKLQLLSTPLFLCSLAIVYSLGLVMRSGSILHIFFAVVGVLTAGVKM